MTKKAQTVLEQALKLSPGEQVTLVDELITNLEESGEPKLTPEFAAELERRAAESRRGARSGPRATRRSKRPSDASKKRRGRRGG